MEQERPRELDAAALVSAWREAKDLGRQARELTARGARAEAATARAIVQQVGIENGMGITGLDADSLRGLVARQV